MTAPAYPLDRDFGRLDTGVPEFHSASDEVSSRRFGWREAFWIALCVAAMLVAIFARMMNFEMRRDEQLYVPPAALMDNWSLYVDFFYNHVPGSAWLFHAVRLGLGTDHLLLAARLGVFLGWVALALGVAWICWRMTRALSVTLFAIIAVLANDLLLNQTGMAGTNNLLPLPLAFLGLGFFLMSFEHERGRPFASLAAGVLIALAASIKANAIGFAVPVAVAAIFLPRHARLSQRIVRGVLPLAAGGILGALPVLFYLGRDAERFLAQVIGFHTGPHIAYWSARSGGDEEAVMSFADKARFAFDMWLGGTNLVILLVLAFLVAYLFSTLPLRSALNRFAGPRKLVIAATAIAAAIMSFLPTPGFPQYFAPPLICLPLLAAALFASLDPGARAAVRPAFIAASLVILLIGVPRLAPSLPRLVSPGSWTVMRTHEQGVAIANRLRGLGVAGKIATLAPVYPLEGRLEVYPELATGQFAYRVADITKPELLRHYRTTSPTKVEAFLASDPPAAILVGFNSELEAPMVRFAQSRGYQRFDDLDLNDRYGKAVLYVRPAGLSPPPSG